MMMKMRQNQMRLAFLQHQSQQSCLKSCSTKIDSQLRLTGVHAGLMTKLMVAVVAVAVSAWTSDRGQPEAIDADP